MLEKTYNPKTFETGWYERWTQESSAACDPKSKAEPYTIMMPPPNVTGSLHIGHALTFTLQDILIRYQRMRGRDVLWQPGTDHAGIATQMVVERMLDKEGINRRDLGRDKFIERVWQWKEESGNTIERQLRSLGALPDWGRERFTMDEGLSHAVRKVFVALHKEGLIYRDKRLVNWDPKLLTAISDLEVEQKEVDGHYWQLHYPIDGMKDSFITVATTRPETMLGDTAVAVHPDDERYKHLVGKKVRLPIMDRLIPVIADEHSDMEKGTGAVKITPAHDFNDFEVGRRHNLEMINIFTAQAQLNENVPEDWQGLDSIKARKRVIEEFEAAGLLGEITKTRHAVPHGDRSGVVIEPWLMDQWYVNAEVLAKPAIKAVEQGQIKIIPERWEKTYFEWMRNIQPWCISRQLWWGHRIPVWYGPDGEIFVAMDEAQAHAAAQKHYGKQTPLTQDEDVLDTWFSSALWPFSTLDWPQETPELARYYPGNVLVTGFDIIFFWVARMIMFGLHFMDGKVPFHDVYIHALVRDEKGQKMSKSKGNVMDPLDISEKYGADALRFTLTAMAAQGRDIKLSESRIAGYRNFATKIWNACRFLEMNDCLNAPEIDLSKVQAPVNQWIVSRLRNKKIEIEKALGQYRFNDAADVIYHFIWDDYCDWYLEIIKPQLTGNAEESEIRSTARQVLMVCLQILHPMMPFITEELWQKGLGGKEMLITSKWPEIAELEDGDGNIIAEINFIIALVSEIRSIRAEMNIPNNAHPELLLMENESTSDFTNFIDRNGKMIERLTRLGSIKAGSSPPSQSVRGILDDMIRGKVEYALSLGGVIDLDAERTRLKTKIDTASTEIKKLESKLNNEAFLAKADKDVVEETRKRLEQETTTQNKLNSMITSIK